MYPVVGDWIVVVFELDSVVVDRIDVRTGLPDGSLLLQSRGFVELSPKLLKLEPSQPNVVCVDFVHVREISAAIHDGIVQSGTDGLGSSDAEFMTDMTDRL